MRVLVIMDDPMHGSTVEILEEDLGCDCTVVDSEVSVHEILDNESRREEIELIVIIDEWMKYGTVEQVMALSKEELKACPSTHETGARICERIRDLGMIERGVRVVCGSVLYTQFGYEMFERVSATGAQFVDLINLPDELRKIVPQLRG